MKAFNELKSSRATNKAACSYDRRMKQSGLNYSVSDRKKQQQPATKKKS
jgi:hypothetical protein